MKHRSLVVIFLIFSFVASFSCKAQALSSEKSLSDYMRSDGKLWVVIAVITIIFIGLIYYLFQIGKRVREIKKRI